MDPKYLIQLATIVELGSVSKAANQLNLTQPTLSRMVKLLEDQVGGPVLRRSRYGVNPTPIGEKLANEGREIRNCSNNAKRAVETLRSGLNSELKIGVGPMLSATFFADFLIDQQQQQSPFEYLPKVFAETAKRLINSLIEGGLDIVIVPTALNMHTETLSQEMIFTDRLAVFTQANSALVKKESVIPADLRESTWIASAASSGLFGTTADVFNAMDLSEVVPTIEFTGDVISTCKFIAATGACCALPLKLGQCLAQDYQIKPIKVSVELPERNISVWMRHESTDNLEMVDFMTRITAYVKKIGF